MHADCGPTPGPRAIARGGCQPGRDRAAAPPRLRRIGGVEAFAPLDLEQGGTWMGVSEFGLFVGLTNRFGVPKDPHRRSRGALVEEALQHPDLASARAFAEGLDPRAENGFHLVVADRREAFCVVGDGRELRAHPLGPGVHVVTERAWGAAPSERQTWLEARFASPGPAALTERALRDTLAQHNGGPFDSVCVHAPAHRYGTRSSAIVEVPTDPHLPLRWAYTEGPPCRHPWRVELVRFQAGSSKGVSSARPTEL